jgi:hypothetical protein
MPAPGQRRFLVKARVPVRRQRRRSTKTPLPTAGRPRRKERSRLPAGRHRAFSTKNRLCPTKDAAAASPQRSCSKKGSLRGTEKSGMTVSMHVVRASLNRPTRVGDLLIYARSIVEAMTGNPWFPAPLPSLAKVQAAIDALEKAQADTLSRTKGLAALRNLALKKLVDLLNRLKAYVQAVANDNPDFAVSIIESARMNVVGSAPGRKLVLAVYRGAVSGSVRLVARAVAKEASYEWQVSDDEGKTWITLPRTMQAKTTVSSKRPGKTYGFRFRAVTRRFTTNWCDPVFYVVQ